MKTICKNKMVESCESGEDHCSDYKWFVCLKNGFVFKGGRNEGSSSLFTNTLRDFKDAEPVSAEEYDSYHKERWGFEWPSRLDYLSKRGG